MSSEAQEVTLLESVVPQLEAEGFEVYTRPSARVLPPFMRNYAPDAIALRKDKKLAIEVLREGASSKRKLDKVRKLFSRHKEWELRVYWVSPSSIPKPVESASRQMIEQAIRDVEELIVAGRSGPALLMSWATFEALGRALLPEKFVRPQTPGRLIEILAADGHLTPSEADHLRSLAERRHLLIHGDLQVTVPAGDVIRFIEILRTLFNLLPPT